MSHWLLAVALLFSGSRPEISAARRDWQTGIIVDAGLKRDLTAGGGAAGRAPFGPPSASDPPTVPQVAVYVIETQRERLQVQDIVAVGASTVNVTVGDRVSLAVSKKTVYIRDGNSHEAQFRLVKRISKSGTSK